MSLQINFYTSIDRKDMTHIVNLPKGFPHSDMALQCRGLFDWLDSRKYGVHRSDSDDGYFTDFFLEYNAVCTLLSDAKNHLITGVLSGDLEIIYALCLAWFGAEGALREQDPTLKPELAISFSW